MKKFSANCMLCEKEFFYTAFRKGKARYCSEKCYHKSRKGKGFKQFQCRYCHVKFMDSPSRNRIYCSKMCVNKCQKETFKPAYTTVRKAMFARNLINECNKCGYKEVPEILGIHHKDGNRKNNEVHNLEVLCPICHSLVHLKHISHLSVSK